MIRPLFLWFAGIRKTDRVKYAYIRLSWPVWDRHSQTKYCPSLEISERSLAGIYPPVAVSQHMGGVDISGIDTLYLFVNYFYVVLDNKRLSMDIFYPIKH